MTNKHTYSVIIIGGGLAGLSLACTFIGKKIKVLIIDSQDNPTNITSGDRRTTALMESSVNYMDNIGVWGDNILTATPLNTMRIIQIIAPNTMGQIVDFNARDAGKDYLAYNVENHALRTIMCEKISNDENITHLFNTNTIDMSKTNFGWTVSTTNTNAYEASLVIGADGRHSFCRDKAGITYKTEDFKQSAIVFNIKHTIPHKNSSTEFMYPEGALTFVPMGTDESAVVWVETSENSKVFKSDIDTLKSTLIRKAQEQFGTIDITSDVQVFPLNKVLAEKFYAERLCLIGEAHHGITPVAAQGLNLSLRDTAVLGEMIINAHNKGDDIGGENILKAYQKKRHMDIRTRSIGTELFHKFSCKNDPISSMIKTAGMGLLNRVSPIKKSLMQLGLSFPNGTPNYMSKKFKI